VKLLNYIEAIKRPFQDIKKLIIGIIIMIIPIVSIIGYGYLLECAKTGLKKKKKMPEWKNFWHLFIKGLGMILIGLVYSIPILLLLAWIIGSAILVGGLAILANVPALIAMILAAGVGVVILLAIVAVLISVLTSAAVIRYAMKGNIKAAFDFSEIFKKALTGEYIIAWIVATFYSVLIAVVLSFIPIVGSGVAAFISGVTMYTILAEAYKKA